jgi:gliding motility-associated-like protein
VNPAFVNAGGTSPDDYLPTVVLSGVTGTGITTDFNGAARAVTPTIGAFEGGSCTNPASGGTIAAAQSGCIPYDPALLTSISPASGYTGASLEYKWQESVTGSGSGFSDIASSNSATYNPGVINQTTWYKRLARVSCIGAGVWTGAAESNVLEVTVNPLPSIGLTVGGANEVCNGTGTNITVALSQAGVNYQLRNGVTNVGAPVAGTTGTINLPTWNLVITTTFNVLATNSVTNCSAQLTQTKLVTVNSLPNTGLSVGGPGTICSGTSGNVTVALSQSGVNYQLRNDNANELVGTPVAGDGGTINLPTGVMTFNIQYNILATNTTTSCSAQLTEKEIVNVYPPSAGGTITGTSSITYGSASGTMTLSGYTGTIQRWEKRYNSGSWTTIANTNATYSETPVPAGTWGYRAVVKSGTCNEANSAEFSITVSPKALTITAENKSKNYGAALPVLTFTYTGLVNGDVATATPPTVTTTATAASPAGTYPITASLASDPNYTISYVAGTLTVDKVPLTIAADNKSKNYGAALPTLTVTYTGLVNGDVATATPPAVNTTATAASPAGTYPITASAAVDPNYNISYVAGTLTVDKVPLTITADNKNKNYGAALPALTVTYSGLVNGDAAPATPATVTTSATAASPAGTYPITASGAADPNYNITYVAGTLTIDKVPLTITAENKNKNYGAALPSLTFTYTGLVNGDLATATPPVINTTATAASPAGTYPITASAAVDPNYNISYVAGTLTVDKVPLTITADNKSKNYGAALPALTVTYTGLVNGDLATATPPVITTTATAASPAGTYPITASAAVDPNYNINYVAGALNVDKVLLTITADNKNKNYGAALPSLTVTYTGLVNGDITPATTPAIITAATASSPAGTYSITASGAADPNYNIGYVAGILTIDPVTLTITAENKSKIYGAALPSFTVTYSGLVNGDVAPATLPLATTTATAASPAGTYTITVSGAVDSNYNISYVSGTLTVDKVPLTITADNKSKIYGSVLPVFTVTYSGLANGDLAPATPPTVTTTATSSSAVGSYPITPSGASDNNYTFTYIDGVLTISKSDQTITFSVLSDKTYGDSDFAPSTSASSGLNVSFVSDNLLVATISGGTIHITGAGSAVITASQSGDGNYNPAPSVARTLSVGKATLTFTADNKSKLYQAQNPVLTYGIAGFVNGESQSVLDVLPSIQTTALQNSTNGDYPITITGGSDNNYTFIYIPGILTITRLQQTITFAGFPEKLLVGDKYTLSATSSSGLTVQFESLDAALATVSGNELTGVSKGNVQIRAFHPGDLNWDAAEAFATVEIYSTHKDIMHLFTPNNDGFNDYWELPDLAAWGKSDVRVFNRWGKLVFSDPDYNNLWDGTSNGAPLPEGPYYYVIETENAGMVKGTVNIVR